MADAGIVRAQAKIRATITGARIYCDMAGRGESFAGFCWSFTDGRTIQGSGRPRMDHKLAAVEDKSKEMKRWLSSSSGLDRRRSPAGQWSYALLTCPPTHCAGLLAGQVCYVGLPGVCCYCTAAHRLIVSRRRLASSKSRASVAASIFWRSVSRCRTRVINAQRIIRAASPLSPRSGQSPPDGYTSPPSSIVKSRRASHASCRTRPWLSNLSNCASSRGVAKR